jgi:hypothetical protein
MVFVIFPYVSKFQFSLSKPDALWDFDAGVRYRVQYACVLTGGYLAASYMLESVEFFNTAGGENIFTVFIIPLWLNVLSAGGFREVFPKRKKCFLAKLNSAPPVFSGALSGFVLMTGYRSGTDTFWPFVISLLIFSFGAMYGIDKREEKFQHHVYGFFIGVIQSFGVFILLK